MNILKKLLRILFLTFLVLLAASGIGMGSIFPNHREKYQNNEVRIELAEKKENDEDGDVGQQ